MSQSNKEYRKAYYQSHKEYYKAYRESHREEHKAKCKEWREAHKEDKRAYDKAWMESHREEWNSYIKSDVNSLGKTKASIRTKSRQYLTKNGKIIKGYEIHHCCTYTEPYKFIYCSKEMHLLIHSYLRQHNIDADSDHYDLIKHLLDDTVILYGIE